MTEDADEFQQRLEELGLEDHWRDVGRTYARIHSEGDDPRWSLLMALEEHARLDADFDALRKEWIRQQHRFYDVSHEVVVDLPDDIRDAIERRMALYGKSPDENPAEFLDLALETIVVTLPDERGESAE